MNTPEENSSFQAVRTAHRQLGKVVRAQNRELREAAERERKIRAQIKTLPEPAAKAYVDVIRRSDLSLSDALAVVSEAFDERDDAG